MLKNSSSYKWILVLPDCTNVELVHLEVSLYRTLTVEYTMSYHVVCYIWTLKIVIFGRSPTERTEIQWIEIVLYNKTSRYDVRRCTTYICGGRWSAWCRWVESGDPSCGVTSSAIFGLRRQLSSSIGRCIARVALLVRTQLTKISSRSSTLSKRSPSNAHLIGPYTLHDLVVDRFFFDSFTVCRSRWYVNVDSHLFYDVF